MAWLEQGEPPIFIGTPDGCEAALTAARPLSRRSRCAPSSVVLLPKALGWISMPDAMRVAMRICCCALAVYVLNLKSRSLTLRCQTLFTLQSEVFVMCALFRLWLYGHQETRSSCRHDQRGVSCTLQHDDSLKSPEQRWAHS
eukprot:3507231-Pleurochrysis_carterae.AAC.2